MPAAAGLEERLAELDSEIARLHAKARWGDATDFERASAVAAVDELLETRHVLVHGDDPEV